MNKLNITKFGFVGIIVATIFLFLVIVPRALAVSETRYHRSDTHTINGLNAYQLGTSQSGSCLTDMVATYGGGACGNGYWKADVYKRDATGTETLLGSNVALISGTLNGYYSATWSAPQTALDSTDAIKIVEKVSPLPAGEGLTKTWITPQLNATQLDAATWTFVRYTYYTCERIGESLWYYYPGLYHGCASYNTRIENFSYSSAPTYVDCGLRMYSGTASITIACEPSGTLTSPLRIRKGTTTYGIVLVATTDSNASAIRIYTSSGVKALRKY